MEEKLLDSVQLAPDGIIRDLRENISLISIKNKKVIRKGKRKKERNFLEKLRFQNEKRFYEAFSMNNFNFLKMPNSTLDSDRESLLLEYIERSNSQDTDLDEFTNAYQELQQIDPKKNQLLDYYNQIFRGYFYRISMVSLFTLGKKINYQTVFKTIKLYFKLNQQQNNLNRKYWVHGDLNENNYFKNTDGDLYFIDFENMFYTRKWPIAEVFTKCFCYNGKLKALDFNPEILCAYLEKLEEESEIKNLNLSLQCRFGLLFQCVREIAQTKLPAKKACYVQLLHTCLSDVDFEEWFMLNITDYSSPPQKKVS